MKEIKFFKTDENYKVNNDTHQKTIEMLEYFSANKEVDKIEAFKNKGYEDKPLVSFGIKLKDGNGIFLEPIYKNFVCVAVNNYDQAIKRYFKPEKPYSIARLLYEMNDKEPELFEGVRKTFHLFNNDHSLYEIQKGMDGYTKMKENMHDER